MPRKRNQPEIICTIENGELHVDSVGFVGNECIEDTLNRELRRIGNVKTLESQPGDERPVSDVGVVEIN